MPCERPESEKHKDPRNQDPRKVWESEEGFLSNSRIMSQFETNGRSMNKLINDNGNWLSEKKGYYTYIL